MRHNVINVLLFLLLAGLATGVWWYADRHWFPKKPKDEQAAKAQEKDKEKDKGKGAEPPKDGQAAKPPEAKQPEVKPPAPKPPEVKPPAPKPPAATPRPPSTLVRLGDDSFYTKALLNSGGAGVQQVALTRFLESTRLGKEARDAAGNTYSLFLIPGVAQPLPQSPHSRPPMKANPPTPDIHAGPVPQGVEPESGRLVVEPSYLVLHYASEDMTNPYPDPLLGDVEWQRAKDEARFGVGPRVLEDGTHQVTFEYEMKDPYFLKLRKTFTLGPKDYHIGFRLDIEAQPGRVPGKSPPFRYQVSGPRGLPIEGEWYTATPRVALIGWHNAKGAPDRQYTDASTIAIQQGGDRVDRAGNSFKYAAIATPFFASALAPDDTAEGSGSWWEYVRATSEAPFGETPNREFAQFTDISFRAVSEKLDPEPGKPITHRYVIYNGPAKVRLLKLLQGDQAVDPALVDRYHDRLGLQTITDYRSENWIGRFANAIYWTDLVIVFTNLMHGLLYAIHQVVGSWGWSIVVLTIMVRLLLFFPSRKQTQMNLRMMEVQKKLQPEIAKLQEKYKDDQRTFNIEKTKLMMARGVNPFAMMGGCLLMLAQMPIMMGLYFGLQESIFFRLDHFLWIDNLSAPDMTVGWGEGIPYISQPSHVGSMLYLGPYLNILPLLAVGLMIWQQNKMMPPPTDEQMAAQQRMMKFMMIAVAVMFYKVSAGLALYFIVSTSWALIERRFVPKAADLPADTGAPAAEKPRGFFGRLRERMHKKLEELQRQAEEQSSRQLKNKQQNPNRNPEQQSPDRRDSKKRRKK